MIFTKKLIAIDFDGTCVTHSYPDMGSEIGAHSVLLELVEDGHQLFLWTCRQGSFLDDAVRWFEKHNIPLVGVNHNGYGDSKKEYADIYIDDRSFGVPLVHHPKHKHPFVDWQKIRKQLLPHKTPKCLICQSDNENCYCWLDEA